ncbi:hypothetical protein [Hyphomicrobium sp. GJ21]|nr:hypothetical protein [Hyphomicrobium sp. GJ21]
MGVSLDRPPPGVTGTYVAQNSGWTGQRLAVDGRLRGHDCGMG